MAKTTEEFLALEPVGEGTGISRDFGLDPVPSVEVFLERLVNSGAVIGMGPNAPGLRGSGSTAAEARAIAMKRLDIERKKLEFQKQTGLRDIGQAREKGLEAAINNALQRGIFRSGIREKNVAEVERESGEARSDLAADIQFALDDLKLRRENVALGAKSGSGGGGGGSLTEGGAINKALDKFTTATDERSVLEGRFVSGLIQERAIDQARGGVVPLTPSTRPGSPK